MNPEIASMIARLEQQKETIDQAIAVLSQLDAMGGLSLPAPTKAVKKTQGKKASPKETAKKSGMSDEGKERVAAAQRKRWAVSKKADKKSAA